MRKGLDLTRAVLPGQGLAPTEPWRYDLFMLLRWVEARNPQLPRLGRATRPKDEPVRLGQKVSLDFAPANVERIQVLTDGRIGIQQRGFGLFGPNGPMPIHLTDHVRERTEVHRDRSMEAFADVFHHRLLLLFYRAWAQVQSTASLDRPGDSPFEGYVACLAGYGATAQRHSDDIPDAAKFFNAGHLVRLSRNAEGLSSMLSGFFACPVRVEERRFQWLVLREQDRTALGGALFPAALGQGAVCGAAVPDRQGRFRLHFGPLDLTDYEAFLPVGSRCRRVRDWVRNYVGLEFAWDGCLKLKAEQVPHTTLGGRCRLGWTTWLGTRSDPGPAADLVLNFEERSMA